MRVNNVSEPATRSCRLAAVTSDKVLKGGVPDVHGRRGKLHPEPQENADDCVEMNVHVAKDPLLQLPAPGCFHHSNGVTGGQPTRVLSGRDYLGAVADPTGQTLQGGGSVRRSQCGEGLLDDVQRAGFRLPDMAPPRAALASSTLVKREDLTLFAESLQLEVVKLRDSMASRDQQLADLRNLLSSITVENADLQKLLEGKQSASEDALAAKDAEIAELRRKLSEIDRQSVYLQQTLIQEQAKWNKKSADKDKELITLTEKARQLEKLNSGLQQLLVRQQDAMKEAMASKDKDIALWRHRAQALSAERPCVSASAGLEPGQSAHSTLVHMDQPVVPTDRVSSESAMGLVSRGSAPSPPPGCVQPRVTPVCDVSPAHPFSCPASSVRTTSHPNPHPPAPATRATYLPTSDIPAGEPGPNVSNSSSTDVTSPDTGVLLKDVGDVTSGGRRARSRLEVERQDQAVCFPAEPAVPRAAGSVQTVAGVQ